MIDLNLTKLSQKYIFLICEQSNPFLFSLSNNVSEISSKCLVIDSKVSQKVHMCALLNSKFFSKAAA